MAGHGDIAEKAVLVETGWSDHWGTDAYFEGHAFLTAKATIFLRDKGGERPVHTTLLGAGIPIVEHMTNLAAIPPSKFHFWAVPPKARTMGTFPVRAHARVCD